jgi:hypothetical protein
MTKHVNCKIVGYDDMGYHFEKIYWENDINGAVKDILTSSVQKFYKEKALKFISNKAHMNRPIRDWMAKYNSSRYKILVKNVLGVDYLINLYIIWDPMGHSDRLRKMYPGIDKLLFPNL